MRSIKSFLCLIFLTSSLAFGMDVIDEQERQPLLGPVQQDFFSRLYSHLKEEACPLPRCCFYPYFTFSLSLTALSFWGGRKLVSSSVARSFQNINKTNTNIVEELLMRNGTIPDFCEKLIKSS